MRRKIELYIGGIQADLDDQNLILYNYAFTDLQTPSAVKNSFSKQVTLPGTPTNARIFGHPARVDREVVNGPSGVGTEFNPGKRTPFEIYDEKRCVIESGYLRLDSVIRKGPVVTGYKVTLFGGIGSFFYSLSYDENGKKKTLADLDYLGTDNPDSELDFTINAAAVEAAWTRLNNAGATAVEQKWDVINFAPAYNGNPEGDFSPNKGVVDAAAVGLAASVTDGSNTYTTPTGSTLINLQSAVDEWAAKDLRSYLQRPILSMKAFLKAIARAKDNGGYSVQLSDDIPITLYTTCWKTLPMLTSLGSGRKKSGDVGLYTTSGTYPANDSDGHLTGTLGLTGSIPQGMKTTAHIYVKPHLLRTNAIGGPIALENVWRSTLSGTAGSNLCVYFAQVVAYNGDVPLAASPVKVLSTRTGWDWSSIAQTLEWNAPYPGTGFEAASNIPLVLDENNKNASTQSYLPFEVSTELPPTSFRFYFFGFFIQTQYTDGVSAAGGETITQARQPASIGTMDSVASNMMWNNADNVNMTQQGSTINYESPNGIRSGSEITKALLLQSEYTPAEYLLSWAKMHGLVFTCNQKTKTIRIMPRDTLFSGAATAPIDLAARIDRSKDITISKQNVSSKWYEFRAAMAEGAFAKEYKSLYGVDFGVQRVDTGYDFDTKAVNLMENCKLRQAATILAHSRYWVKISVGGSFRPSPFLDKGVTYTLWDNVTLQPKTFPVPGIPASATLDMYNTDYDYYDSNGGVMRLDLRDADGKPVDGTDILVYYNFRTTYAKFKLTDDTALMVSLNDGKPCWDLSEGAAIAIPNFSQFRFSMSGWIYTIERSLNFGLPREVDIPGVVFDSNASLYARYWRAYLSDLLNENTKVMKCRVDFRGLEVGPELLRKFYHYEGALWVLNKITNYSLTTYDAVECEFVQVQNPENYTNGQILN